MPEPTSRTCTESSIPVGTCSGTGGTTSCTSYDLAGVHEFFLTPRSDWQENRFLLHCWVSQCGNTHTCIRTKLFGRPVRTSVLWNRFIPQRRDHRSAAEFAMSAEVAEGAMAAVIQEGLRFRDTLTCYCAASWLGALGDSLFN